ncbi:MAG: 1-deoxy-D-xylulose-5-phosphate synthase [Porticoccaceae bacterium]|jgi:1-deoxy-D-xylulose-5-phosphate synthase|nr:1-deoxy-D-xylulose-5-phosphate synthase [Porticoccaceae bacterium]MEA3299479.1 1-deoxy-D-xylulose-5-phosphate synthase [Pseudomonadota bacterium]HLS99788.1 1-deoxy-D-xylulose-5-phosphate synthase [Porticoccaceae bacterium]
MPKKFTEIPLARPATPLLDGIGAPAELRKLDDAQLLQLADELRAYLLYAVGRSGGHFGAGLGVIELTIALHYVFNTPTDRLVWDVGHQTYPHKILTGRREAILKVRQEDGISGFPKRAESRYDTFGVGHSSTSISAALGMALAAHMDNLDRRVVAVIGDGAMTAGMAFEALNHTAHTDANLLVILNDNSMSISRNVGGLATYFSKIWASRFYNSIREGGKKVLKAIPSAAAFVRKTEEHLKAMVAPGIVFEELGFNYIGPIDGHDLPLLVQTLSNLKDLNEPVLLHTITRKGQGFVPAEQDPIGYHALNKIEPAEDLPPPIPARAPKPASPKYQDVFGAWLVDTAMEDPRLVAITPAMCEGSGMKTFAERFPDRFHDVAIAEQHAVTFAAGLACEGKKPVVAIYSTFLQRAYDQLIHDVALQDLDVLFALDRAGLVGEDGATHAGSFDISYLRCIPNMVVMTPSDENETRQMLHTGYQHSGPASVRYPRGTGPGAAIDGELTALPLGKGVIRRLGRGVAILNFGALLPQAMAAAAHLDASVADMRFVKPLDTGLIDQLAGSHDLLVTLEDNAVMGGAGSAVGEYLAGAGLTTPLIHLGLPDQFIDHATRDAQLAAAGLNDSGIIRAVTERLARLRPRPESAAVDRAH